MAILQKTNINGDLNLLNDPNTTTNLHNGDFLMSGTDTSNSSVYLNNDTTYPLGKVLKSAPSSNITLSTSSKNITSINLTTGTWLLIGMIRFSSIPGTFICRLNIDSSSATSSYHVAQPVYDSACQVTTVRVVKCTGDETYYLNAYTTNNEVTSSNPVVYADGDYWKTAMQAILIG